MSYTNEIEIPCIVQVEVKCKYCGEDISNEAHVDNDTGWLTLKVDTDCENCKKEREAP